MCTILMLSARAGHLLLAGNRDEQRARPAALPPRQHVLTSEAGATMRALYPIDAQAGGTWIGVNAAGVAMTLLNNYQRSAVFDTEGAPRSRGLILPELLKESSLEQVHLAIESWAEREARHTFPFTLAAGSANEPGEALVAEWSGRELTITRRELPLLLVSSGFDLEGVSAAREATLHEFLDAPAWGGEEELAEAITRAFSEGGEAPNAYTVCMSRDDARTVSHSRVAITPEHARFTYLDGPPCGLHARHESVLERAPLS